MTIKHNPHTQAYFLCFNLVITNFTPIISNFREWDSIHLMMSYIKVIEPLVGRDSKIYIIMYYLQI